MIAYRFPSAVHLMSLLMVGCGNAASQPSACAPSAAAVSAEETANNPTAPAAKLLKIRVAPWEQTSGRFAPLADDEAVIAAAANAPYSALGVTVEALVAPADSSGTPAPVTLEVLSAGRALSRATYFPATTGPDQMTFHAPFLVHGHPCEKLTFRATSGTAAPVERTVEMRCGE